MKIILGERFNSTINNIDRDIKEEGVDNIPLAVNSYDRKYMLDFKVVDLAKANTFITAVLTNPETYAEIEDKLGIRIEALKYNTNVENVKNVLREALEKLENM